jgi:hypothetical protein
MYKNGKMGPAETIPEWGEKGYRIMIGGLQLLTLSYVSPIQ